MHSLQGHVLLLSAWQACDIYTCMHGTAVSTGVDMNGAPTMACQCLPDWAGAE
jgi:hypothetical protein